MNSNKDECDLGYIEIIENEQNLYKEFDKWEKNANNYNCNKINNNSQLNDNTFDINGDEMSLNVKQYYNDFVFNEKNGFICCYEDCEQIEVLENAMVLHVIKHLNHNKTENNRNDLICVKTEVIEENESQLKVNENEIISNDRNEDICQTEQYVCDWKDCNMSFTQFESFETHKSQHLIEELLESDRKSEQSFNLNEIEFEGIREYIDVLNKKGNDMYVCKWKRCAFKSCKARVMSRHIHNIHLNSKKQIEQKVKPIKSQSNKSIQSTKALTKPKPKSNSKEILNTINTQISPKIAHNSQNLINILTPEIKSNSNSSKSAENNVSNISSLNMKINITPNNAVFMSCKGLNSAFKVQKYFQKVVIDGQKTYSCIWNNCKYSTKKSQEIAIHINVKHLGFRFKCHKENCNKVYATSHAWRNHQKNHICGFGIYGYGKNVIGVCKMDNINKYNQKLIVDGKRSFRCTYRGCNVVFKGNSSRNSIKRHIHNQHICPYRVNSKVFKNNNPNIDKISEDNSLTIDSNFFITKRFECKRTECNAKFSVYSDLLKHQNILCKFKKENKNINSMQNVINKQNVKLLVKKEKNECKMPLKSEDKYIETNISENKKEMNAENNLSISDKTQSIIKSNPNQYYSTKLIKDVNYYLCKWNDCLFTTNSSNKIVEHIESHIIESQSINYAKESNTREIVEKRKHSPQDSQTNGNKFRKIGSNKRIETRIKVNETHGMDLKSQKSDDNLNKYFQIKRIDGEPNYFCKWNECKHYTNSLNEMTQHLNEKHIHFTCGIDNCQKTFQSESILSIHKINHLCGFGIKGRKSIGICDLDNIRKYRNEKLVNGKYVYSCKWSECEFVNESRTIALSHIHNRHICPNRKTTFPSIPKLKVNSNVNQSPKINAKKVAKAKNLSEQKEYMCKRHKCGAILKNYSDLLKHENLLCKYKNYDKFNVSIEPNSGRHRTDNNLQSNEPRNRNTSEKMNSNEIIGTYGSQNTLQNFKKYSQRKTKDGKPFYFCIYPNCSETRGKRYNTPLKGNMIRHIRSHCKDKPFVCEVDGCERSFSELSTLSKHQNTCHNIN